MIKKDLTVLTEDNHKIIFDHYTKGFPEVIILAHGFYNNKDTYLFKKIAKMFAKKYDVISFDFRGHGRSDGLFCWTSKEDKDLRCVIDWSKKMKYKKIGVIGFSLGAAIALIEGSKTKDINSIIAVSSPYDFWKMNYHFWKEEMFNDLKLNLGYKGKGKCIRPGNPFSKKVSPINIVDKISPKPVLFLHGEKDWLINPSHSRKLFNKAKQPKQIYIIKGAGHAEKIFDSFPEQFEKRCLDWFAETLTN